MTDEEFAQLKPGDRVGVTLVFVCQRCLSESIGWFQDAKGDYWGICGECGGTDIRHEGDTIG